MNNNTGLIRNQQNRQIDNFSKIGFSIIALGNIIQFCLSHLIFAIHWAKHIYTLHILYRSISAIHEAFVCKRNVTSENE